MLSQAGIDTKTFKAHSKRSASVSKASALGVSLSEIIRRGQWTIDSTFRKEIKEVESFDVNIVKSVKK